MARGRNQLLQQFQPLGVEFGRQDADPGCIAAGMGERANQPEQDEIVARRQDRDRPGRFLRGTDAGRGTGHDRVEPGRDEHRRNPRSLLFTHRELAIDLQALSFDKPRTAQLVEHRERGRGLARLREHNAETVDPSALLRASVERPQGRRAAQEKHQFSTPHSITSSAPARSVCGTVRPSALAVLRLITSSNLVGCWTGRSAGLAPLRIFPA